MSVQSIEHCIEKQNNYKHFRCHDLSFDPGSVTLEMLERPLYRLAC